MPSAKRLPPPESQPDRTEDIMYWISKSDNDEPEREHEDIMLRRVPRAIAHRFRGAAGARGLTHAQYLTALVTLHEQMRHNADNGDDAAAQHLQELGLSTVAI